MVQVPYAVTQVENILTEDLGKFDIIIESLLNSIFSLPFNHTFNVNCNFHRDNFFFYYCFNFQ